ncbi:MAG: flagellin [Deltaproteobacteria bacterium]|nr:flagellin [Deltaproteobacteria bacterium]
MMSAGITLTAGMRQNLFSLQSTQTLMEKTQTRLSSGKKVNSALDNPINFFTAQEHTLRATDLASRKDGMSEAIQTIKAANNGLEGITTLISNAKALAQSALSATSTTENVTYACQYEEVLSQITQMSDDSGYKGINLLDGTDDVVTVQFAPASNSASLTITGFEACAGGLDITSDTGGAWVDGTDNCATVINAAIATLDTARDTLRAKSKELATNLGIVTARQDFTTNMINTLEEGSANLVNADLNEEGANMLMLQTRQALGTTSLSMASQSAQSVLRLF